MNTDDGIAYLGKLRVCNLCNTEDLEDEFHYLLKSNYFNEKRKTCIDKNKDFKNSNTLKFGAFMKLTKKSKIKKIYALLLDLLIEMSVLMAEKMQLSP